MAILKIVINHEVRHINYTGVLETENLPQCRRFYCHGFNNIAPIAYNQDLPAYAWFTEDGRMHPVENILIVQGNPCIVDIF